MLSEDVSQSLQVYQPTWESITKHQTPDWFRDAKFGIYFHWGPYSVPAYGTEWYSRHMYIEDHDVHKYHVATYGTLDKFGYKDFIPMFTGELFDPDAWVDLFRKAGARFVGPVAEHADGFSMWDSKLNPFNAARMGPKRDVVGEMERAVRSQGLKFITTFHHMWLWGWYPTYDPTVDAGDPAYAALYGPRTEPGAFDKPEPDDAFCDMFVAKVKEVIDKYRPDLLYFDGRMYTIGDRHRRDFVSYYYNAAARWGREVVVTYKDEDLPPGAGVLDMERGRMKGIRDFVWMTDDSICWKSWAHLKDPEYKTAKQIIDGLVDIVSKNGTLLLNVTPTADGIIPDEVKELLLEVGAWLRINGAAIYGTRPWIIYGEGPNESKEGHFTEKENPPLTADDIRFTTKGNSLYVICMEWPGRPFTVKSVTSPRLAGKKVDSVKLLGSEDSVAWNIDDSGLSLVPPLTRPCPHACVFEVVLKDFE